jgi:leader peptidase (prepilin peptidase)/N-methyltransferase
MSGFLQAYLVFVSFVFGAVVGSFLNVCVHRMPRGESVARPPSHCPHCNSLIRWYHNIPLVSWLWLRGRCANCRAWISARYFLVELLTAVLFVAVWVKFSGWVIPAYWVLVAGLIVATFIDFEHYIIPDEITYGGVVVGFVLSVAAPELHDSGSRLQSAGRSLLGVAVGTAMLWVIIEAGKLAFGRLKVQLEPGTVVRFSDGRMHIGQENVELAEVFSRESDRVRFRARTLSFGEQKLENVAVEVSETTVRVDGQEHALAEVGAVEAATDLLIIPREAMGLGDLKFLAAIGAFLGWQSTVFILMASSFLGSIVGLSLLVFRLRDWGAKIPYGPYIACGALLWMFWGKDLVDWYFDMLRG